LFNFYRVSEDEINKEIELFRSGRYKFQYEQVEFDMAEHNKMLVETENEVKEIRKKQREVQEEMIQAEKESLAKWRKDKENQKVDEGTVDALLAGTVNSSDFPFIDDQRMLLTSRQTQPFLRSMRLSMRTFGRSWSKKARKSARTR
jgi:hypothetical protein